MKTPSKKELYERIAFLEEENQKLNDKLNRQNQMEWDKHISDAFEMAKQELEVIYPKQVKYLHFVRVDASGYWFTYVVGNDTFTYSVRHSEVKTKSV
jgi:hypothetical protein